MSGACLDRLMFKTSRLAEFCSEKELVNQIGHDSDDWPLHALARALGGEIVGDEVLAPGPGHSPRDRSLSVKISKTGKIVVHSFADDDWRVCRDYVNERLGLSPDASKSRREPRRRPRNVPAVQRRDDDKTRQRAALSLWDKACDPRGSIVEIYLKSRGLELPDETAGEAIRYHAHCAFGAERHPAMVCLVRNIVTNEPQAIRRTALGPDGRAIKRDSKTFRMSLGPVANGAIKIDADEAVEQGLCLGEGVETCLSGRQKGLRPVWAAISTANLAKFPVFDGIEGLHLFAENDANGASGKAVEKCARRWHSAGRTVFIVTPEIGKDLNDELRSGLT